MQCSGRRQDELCLLSAALALLQRCALLMASQHRTVSYSLYCRCGSAEVRNKELPDSLSSVHAVFLVPSLWGFMMELPRYLQ